MSKGLENKKILKTANKIHSNYKLCDHCLGRIFAKVESGLTNQKRGQTLRKNLRNFPKDLLGYVPSSCARVCEMSRRSGLSL